MIGNSASSSRPQLNFTIKLILTIIYFSKRLIYCKIDSRYKRYNQVILPKLSPIRPGDLLAVYVGSLIPTYVDPKPARPLNGPHPNSNVLSCFNPSGLVSGLYKIFGLY